MLDNGGPTWTHALWPGSPAINKGKYNALTNLVCAFDQRCMTRPFALPGSPTVPGGDGSDIGAFEAQTLTRPPLYVSSSAGGVTVYLPSGSGFNLQQKNDLSVPGGWSTITSGWTTSNGTNFWQINSPTGSSFFRLASP